MKKVLITGPEFHGYNLSIEGLLLSSGSKQRYLVTSAALCPRVPSG